MTSGTPEAPQQSDDAEDDLEHHLASISVNGIDLSRFADFANPAYKSLVSLLGDAIPRRRYGHMDPSILADRHFPKTGQPSVLDIGCGSAQSAKMFLDLNENTRWHGVEIAETYNIADLKDLPEGVSIYDGVNIPFDTGSFDFCYSKQVFEHVRHPETLLDDIHRVLKPDGMFFGSLSGGEPYHWHSLFHFTPLGWKTVLEDHGFKLERLFAGVDALTLLLHHWSENRKDMGRYFRHPLLFDALNNEPDKEGRAILYENALKLAFAGHLVFVARKLN